MDFKDDYMKWKLLGSERIVDRKWLKARRDTVQLPNGVVYDEYYVLEYPDWINVIAETTDNKLLLERQYRHALGQIGTEIPAGVMEKGETPLQAAQRELSEETGFAGGLWTEITTLSPNAAAMNNLLHTFLARGVKKVSGQHLDTTEDIHVFEMDKKDVFEMLCKDEFKQATMVASLWKYFALYTDFMKAGLPSVTLP